MSTRGIFIDKNKKSFYISSSAYDIENIISIITEKEEIEDYGLIKEEYEYSLFSVMFNTQIQYIYLQKKDNSFIVINNDDYTFTEDNGKTYFKVGSILDNFNFINYIDFKDTNSIIFDYYYFKQVNINTFEKFKKRDIKLFKEIEKNFKTLENLEIFFDKRNVEIVDKIVKKYGRRKGFNIPNAFISSDIYTFENNQEILKFIEKKKLI